MIRRLIPYSRSWSMERSMMDKQEKRLKALWLRRQRSAEPSAASLDLAEWVETSEIAEPENGPIESLLASSRSAREAVDNVRVVSAQPVGHDTHMVNATPQTRNWSTQPHNIHWGIAGLYTCTIAELAPAVVSPTAHGA